ncbi:MAG: hypothetical protein WBA97_07380 [Actinophytocola sp.]|uniref:hypothetical protein n=1 Tax=Actinophytocola sp. TaxID=1872138 RepID=UPI003C78964C
MLLFVAAALAATLYGSATADVRGAADISGITGVSASDDRAISLLDFSCPAGQFCAWPSTDGSSRCTWVNADSNWRDGSVICSWGETRPVIALNNNGSNLNYAGVCVYAGFSYVTLKAFVERGTLEFFDGAPFKARSHRWVRSVADC